MRDQYQEQLRRLVAQLADLGELAEDAMLLATRAMLDVDLRLAEQVIADDVRLDRERASCEQRSRLLLALQAPVASDLRTVLAVIHIAHDLERMGDLAGHVAKAVRRRHPSPVAPEVLRARFAEMGRIAVGAAGTTTRVIRFWDVSLAHALSEADDEMDELHRTLFSVLSYSDWDHGVSTAVDVSLVSRFYERFSDHAVSAASQVAMASNGRSGRSNPAAPPRRAGHEAVAGPSSWAG
ncbi:MAG TPA: phosphate signaling complex protein PhoU [Pseudonocardia sp.]|jgi:phosphate transport system protein|uniref:phosphate signaling complex protein PhoU n=1 Tax=Pseudonocardia sp. TaxID=60912 RepID=UPI002CDB48AF|nr:phosphate signaling complex protein PhoU [Pseudonocardia sp.]HTF52150.1 phosphate signaling complex protein PhoU [Pseudonocardia sp.]